MVDIPALDKERIEIEKLLAWYVRHVMENEGTDFLWADHSPEERRIMEIALQHGAYDETWEDGIIIRPSGKSDAQIVREALAKVAEKEHEADTKAPGLD